MGITESLILIHWGNSIRIKFHASSNLFFVKKFSQNPPLIINKKTKIPKRRGEYGIKNLIY